MLCVCTYRRCANVTNYFPQQEYTEQYRMHKKRRSFFQTAVADPGFGQGGGAKNFFPRFCRHSKAKSGKQSEQYNISI